MSISNSLTETAGGAMPPPPTTGADPMATYPARQRKTAPLHPGLVAADSLEGAASPRVAAKAMGMSHTGLVKVLNGTSPVTPETALRFAAYFGNSPEHWLAMQRDFDLWHARAKLAKELARIKPLGD